MQVQREFRFVRADGSDGSEREDCEREMKIRMEVLESFFMCVGRKGEEKKDWTKEI